MITKNNVNAPLQLKLIALVSDEYIYANSDFSRWYFCDKLYTVNIHIVKSTS